MMKNKNQRMKDGKEDVGRTSFININEFISSFPDTFKGAGATMNAKDLNFLQKYFSGNSKRTVNKNDVKTISGIMQRNIAYLTQGQKDFLQKFLNNTNQG